MGRRKRFRNEKSGVKILLRNSSQHKVTIFSLLNGQIDLKIDRSKYIDQSMDEKKFFF